MAHPVLTEIGYQLDGWTFPQVGRGGIVIPTERASVCETSGNEDTFDERETTRRSTAESWQRAAGRQGAPPRTRGRSASSAPSVVGPDPEIRYGYPEILEEITPAYPGARAWRQESGFWLLTESALLEGGFKRAKFLTGVSEVSRLARSWAFWDAPIYRSPQWIGPRHTYLDGSVCAFEPSDGTWKFGDSLVTLLDLYTLWAFRQLHLEVTGRWPGPQVATLRLERLVELRPDELCGCENPRGRYRDCCQAKDISELTAADFVLYQTVFGHRAPPRSVLEFVGTEASLPELDKVVTLQLPS